MLKRTVKHKRWLFALGIAAVGLVGLQLAQGADDDLDSLKVCKETQKLLLENSFVRVIDDVIAPGVAEPKHRHSHGLVVTLSDSDMETKSYPIGTVTRSHLRFGAVSWNEQLMHET